MSSTTRVVINSRSGFTKKQEFNSQKGGVFTIGSQDTVQVKLKIGSSSVITKTETSSAMKGKQSTSASPGSVSSTITVDTSQSKTSHSTKVPPSTPNKAPNSIGAPVPKTPLGKPSGVPNSTKDTPEKPKAPAKSSEDAPAKFVKRLKDLTAKEGSAVEFKCQIDGGGKLKVKWLYENKEILPSPNKKISLNGKEAVLVVEAAQPDDGGIYACEVSNGIGNSNPKCTAKLTVTEDRTKKFNGKAPIFDKVLKDQSFEEGNDVRLECSVKGMPNPKITWLLDGNKLFGVDGFGFLKEGNKQILTIENVDEGCSGKYTCKAVNGLGSQECSATVTVTGGSEEESEEEESEEESEEEVEEEAKVQKTEAPAEKSSKMAPEKKDEAIDANAAKPDKSQYIKPYFDEQEEDVYAIENKPYSILCKFHGVPTPKITWMLEDEIIHSEDHFGVVVDEETLTTTLEIDSVTVDDIGEYECIAVNAKGYDSCKLYLDVAEPPSFVETFEDTIIPFGSSLRLDCRLGGIPEPDVVWCKDDMPLKQSGRVKYLFEGEDGASLMLENFSRGDCGEYSIIASNVAGEVTHLALVSAPGVAVEPFKRFNIKKDIRIEEEYEILDELGRGAYGIVKKAIDKRNGEERAAKFITIKAGMWEEVRNEIRVMGMLEHKRLIGLYDAYETNDSVANKREINMVMELVTGGELFERIVSQDTITEGEAVYFLKQVIEGVHHMHERNIVHLDLKPENILLESADSDLIKVIDFGLAQVLKPDEELKCSCGTAEFVAPEIVNKKPVTTASDVWSIGVIAYILLSGCSPFMGEDDRQTLMNVREGHWEFEEDIWDEISEEAKDFISHLLEVDVTKRYTLQQCLEHPWLKFDERRDQGLNKLSTDRLKNFNLKRKWKKALNAVRSIMRLQRLASLIKEEEEEEEGEMAQTLETVPEEPIIEGTEGNITEQAPNHIGEENKVHIKAHENHIEESRDGDEVGIREAKKVTNERQVAKDDDEDIEEEPDIPSRPKIPLISSSEALLTWRVDVQPGKPEVTGYTVMQRQLGEDGWILLADNIEKAYLHAKNLKPNTEYRFRVSCITKHGKGQLGKPSILVKTGPPGTPPLQDEVIKAQVLTHSRCISYDRRLSNDSLYSDGGESEEEEMIIQDLSLNKEESPKRVYDFLTEIDRGRFSVVRKCRRKENSKEYAAKLMKLAGKDKNRCLEEHKILQELKHPNIVQLREAFQTNELVILIMSRYFAGDILKHITRTDIFTEELIANVTLQILDALNYLHMNKIVFLDLRHDNLLIESRRRERVRLIDFGSARKVNKSESVRVPRMEFLTEFIAPEIAEGGEVAFETDVWSLGVLVFTWLSGMSPFLARTEEKTLYNITRVKYNMESLQDNVSEEAREFLKKVFVQDPSERLSVAECFDDHWLHCNSDMINKRTANNLITRRLRRYRNDYRARTQSLHLKHSIVVH